MTGRLYPGLTREALLAREAALERFAEWKAAHPVVLPPSAAIAAVAALYEMLPAESRRRAPDPSGVMTFHALMARATPPSR
ncbi:MAG TPA: hypothetical protein PLB88_11540 [Thermoanaerobaculaceae bacterium]|nr:hypothetical protein [Thermoanaerobaculaceae bacterium]